MFSKKKVSLICYLYFRVVSKNLLELHSRCLKIPSTPDDPELMSLCGYPSTAEEKQLISENVEAVDHEMESLVFNEDFVLPKIDNILAKVNGILKI